MKKVKKNANTGKHSLSQSRAKLVKQVLPYWGTTKTLFAIAKEIGCRQPTIKDIFLTKYGNDALDARSSGLYRISKLGKNNPMTGKNGASHHNFKGACSDCKGYYTVIKPSWWTGKNKKRVFLHHILYAAINALTEIPAGYDVHHMDFNKENNDPRNLQLLTKSEHARLH